MLAAVMGFAFIRLLGEKEGWKYPFMIGGGIATVGFYMRYRLKETRTFCKAKAKIQKGSTLSFREIFKTHRKNIAVVAGISFLDSAAFYLAYVYIPDIFRRDLGLSAASVMGHNTIMMFFDMVVCVIFAGLGDRYGSKKIAMPSCLMIMLLAFPIFLFMTMYKSYACLTVAQVMIIFIAVSYFAPLRPFMASLFPAIGRYTGYAFGWYLGRSIVLGVGGFICLFLKQGLGDIGPAIFLTCCALISFLSLRYAVPHGEPLNNDDDLEKESDGEFSLEEPMTDLAKG
jgi:predicted MFS family arabinose efflux permease